MTYSGIPKGGEQMAGGVSAVGPSETTTSHESLCGSLYLVA